jgi:hypothetical protein
VEAPMTTVTAQRSGSFWNRARYGIIEVVVMIALTISLVVAATSDPPSTAKPDIARIGVVRSTTPASVCVPRGGARTC